MDRRSFLATTGIIGLAGCAGGEGSPSQSANDDIPSETQTSPETPQTTETQIPPAESNYSNELREVSAGQFMAKRYLRYFDEDSGDLKEVYPDHDWFCEVTITVKNLGGEPIDPPSLSKFSLLADEQQFDLSLSLPEVSWENVRLRDKHSSYWIEPHYSADYEIDPGKEQIGYVIGDVASTTYPQVVFEADEGAVRLEVDQLFLPDRIQTPARS